jgi:hypothetical protein
MGLSVLICSRQNGLAAHQLLEGWWQSRARRRELEIWAVTAGIDDGRDVVVQRRLQGEAVIGVEAQRSGGASVWV